MYLHIGNNKNIRTGDIVGIFDTDTSTVSKCTKQYLVKSEKNGETVNVTTELPKAFVLCSDDKKKNTVYFSQLSVKTLCTRAEDLV